VRREKDAKRDMERGRVGESSSTGKRDLKDTRTLRQPLRGKLPRSQPVRDRARCAGMLNRRRFESSEGGSCCLVKKAERTARLEEWTGKGAEHESDRNMRTVHSSCLLAAPWESRPSSPTRPLCERVRLWLQAYRAQPGSFKSDNAEGEQDSFLELSGRKEVSIRTSTTRDEKPISRSRVHRAEGGAHLPGRESSRRGEYGEVKSANQLPAN
jgi:hypothetical protein